MVTIEPVITLVTVTVNNVAPERSIDGAPTRRSTKESPFTSNLSATFTDAGAADTHRGLDDRLGRRQPAGRDRFRLPAQYHGSSHVYADNGQLYQYTVSASPMTDGDGDQRATLITWSPSTECRARTVDCWCPIRRSGEGCGGQSSRPSVHRQ